jgi:hypothetical protein
MTFFSRRSSVDEAAVRAAVFLTTNQLHEEQEDSQDALLLEVSGTCTTQKLFLI